MALWSLSGLFPRHKPFLGTPPAPCSSSHPWRGLCGHTASPHRSDKGWTPHLRWTAIRFFWEIWRWEPELVSSLWEAELAPCHHKAELVRREQEPGGAREANPQRTRWSAERQATGPEMEGRRASPPESCPSCLLADWSGFLSTAERALSRTEPIRTG